MEFICHNYSAASVFIAILIFSNAGNYIHSEKTNFEVSFFPATLFLCIFLFYVYFFKLYAATSLNYSVTFTEKLSFYAKLLLVSSLVTALLFLVFAQTGSMIGRLSKEQIMKEALMVFGFSIVLNMASFTVIYVVNRVSYLRSHILIGVSISAILAFCINMLALAYLFNRIYVYSVQTFLFTLLITVALYSILLYQNSRAQFNILLSAASRKDAEYQQLKNQINPHFLFNNLNTLISFIDIDPKKAIDFGHSLANIYRHFLKNQQDDFVPLKQELDFIVEYLLVYKTKFANAIILDIQNSAAADQYVLSSALQELIDNIFKHNEVDDNAPLRIQISINDEFLIVQNTKRPTTGETSSGIGLQNISNRYTILTQKNSIIDDSAEMFTVKLPIFSI